MRRVLVSVLLAIALGLVVGAVPPPAQPYLPAGPSTDQQPQPIWVIRIPL